MKCPECGMPSNLVNQNWVDPNTLAATFNCIGCSIQWSANADVQWSIDNVMEEETV